MAPGQSTYSFQVQIIDRGINGTPVHALAYLYGSYPDSLGANNNSLVTILHDDTWLRETLPIRSPFPVPTTETPRRHQVLRRPRLRRLPRPQSSMRRSKPPWPSALVISRASPGAHRFYMWNMGRKVAGQVAHYLEGTQLQQPGTTVMLSTYSLFISNAATRRRPRSGAL